MLQIKNIKPALFRVMVSHLDKFFLFLISLFAQIPFINKGLNPVDGGYWMLASSRILSGEIPYKDFHLGYTPLNFYLMGGFFGAFGEAVISYRIYRMLIVCLLVVCTYMVGNHLMPKKYSIIPALLVLIAGTTLWTRSLALMLGMLLLLIVIERRSLSSYFILGITVSLSFWVGHEMGSLMFVSAFVLIISMAFSNNQRSDKQRNLRTSLVRSFRLIGIYALGLIVGFLPFGIYFYIVDALFPMLTQLFPDTAEMLKLTNRNFPSITSNLPTDFRRATIWQWSKYIVFTGSWYLPFVTYIIFGGQLLVRLKKGWEKIDEKIFVILLTGIGLLAFAIVPGGWSHLLYALPPTWILLSFGSFRLNQPLSRKFFLKKWRHLSGGVGSFFILSFLCLSLLLTFQMRFKTLSKESFPIQIEGQTFWLSHKKGLEIKKMVEFVKSSLNSNDLFITAYDPLLYLLLKQKNPLYMSQFSPGHLSAASERRVIEEIEQNSNIKLLVMRDQSPWKESGLTLPDYAHKLDKYLKCHFFRVRKIGPYTIMERNEENDKTDE